MTTHLVAIAPEMGLCQRGPIKSRREPCTRLM